jgi:glycosyltransferase involved in cell wall biosynthesis
MFKVLVITYYFPPLGLSGVQRTLKFTEYMKDYNWEPTVLTTRKVGYYAHDHSLLKEAEEAGIRIIRTEGNDPNSLLYKLGTIKLPREKVRKTLNRISQTVFIPDNKISWASKAMRKAKKILAQEKFDLIFVSCPPFSVFVKACQLKKKFNIPLAVDYRDLWYESYFSFYPTLLHKYLNKRLEYNSLKSADKVIVTNRKIKEKLLNNFKFLTFEDVVIIPHGYDLKDFEIVQSVQKSNDKMIIGYSGIFLEYNTPVYFLRAFKQIVKERPDIASKIELHFIGHLRKENKRFVRRLNIQEYVKDLGYLEHRISIQKLLSCDVLWLMVGEKRNIDAILPGKIHEYMGTKKPIIGCVPDGAAKYALEEYGASFITKPYDIDEIKRTILKIYELFKEKKLPVPDEDVVNKYRRDYLTEQLTKQFQFLVRS